MDIKAEKIALAQLILETESEEVIKKIKSLLVKYVKPEIDETNYLNSSVTNRNLIKESLSQLDKGLGKSIKTADLWK